MSKRQWITTVGIGLIGNWAITWAFDFLLYPLVISTQGLFRGTIVMTFLSFLLCYFSILFYDKTKKDWFGIETLKGVKDFTPLEVPKSFFKKYFIRILNSIGKVTSWIMRKSDMVAFIVLSIKFDPFITVVHIRHGAHQFNGLSKRDWKIFITSLIIGNAYWAITVYMGITILEAVWKFVSQLSLF